jgi:hypothetical protein
MKVQVQVFMLIWQKLCLCIVIPGFYSKNLQIQYYDNSRWRPGARSLLLPASLF